MNDTETSLDGFRHDGWQVRDIHGDGTCLAIVKIDGHRWFDIHIDRHADGDDDVSWDDLPEALKNILRKVLLP